MTVESVDSLTSAVGAEATSGAAEPGGAQAVAEEGEATARAEGVDLEVLARVGHRRRHGHLPGKMQEEVGTNFADDAVDGGLIECLKSLGRGRRAAQKQVGVLLVIRFGHRGFLQGVRDYDGGT